MSIKSVLESKNSAYQTQQGGANNNPQLGQTPVSGGSNNQQQASWGLLPAAKWALGAGTASALLSVIGIVGAAVLKKMKGAGGGYKKLDDIKGVDKGVEHIEMNKLDDRKVDKPEVPDNDPNQDGGSRELLNINQGRGNPDAPNEEGRPLIPGLLYNSNLVPIENTAASSLQEHLVAEESQPTDFEGWFAHHPLDDVPESLHIQSQATQTTLEEEVDELVNSVHAIAVSVETLLGVLLSVTADVHVDGLNIQALSNQVVVLQMVLQSGKEHPDVIISKLTELIKQTVEVLNVLYTHFSHQIGDGVGNHNPESLASVVNEVIKQIGILHRLGREASEVNAESMAKIQILQREINDYIDELALKREYLEQANEALSGREADLNAEQARIQQERADFEMAKQVQQLEYDRIVDRAKIEVEEATDLVEIVGSEMVHQQLLLQQELGQRQSRLEDQLPEENQSNDEVNNQPNVPDVVPQNTGIPGNDVTQVHEDPDAQHTIGSVLSKRNENNQENEDCEFLSLPPSEVGEDDLDSPSEQDQPGAVGTSQSTGSQSSVTQNEGQPPQQTNAAPSAPLHNEGLTTPPTHSPTDNTQQSTSQILEPIQIGGHQSNDEVNNQPNVPDVVPQNTGIPGNDVTQVHEDPDAQHTIGSVLSKRNENNEGGEALQFSSPKSSDAGEDDRDSLSEQDQHGAAGTLPPTGVTQNEGQPPQQTNAAPSIPLPNEELTTPPTHSPTDNTQQSTSQSLDTRDARNVECNTVFARLSGLLDNEAKTELIALLNELLNGYNVARDLPPNSEESIDETDVHDETDVERPARNTDFDRVIVELRQKFNRDNVASNPDGHTELQPPQETNPVPSEEEIQGEHTTPTHSPTDNTQQSTPQSPEPMDTVDTDYLIGLSALFGQDNVPGDPEAPTESQPSDDVQQTTQHTPEVSTLPYQEQTYTTPHNIDGLGVPHSNNGGEGDHPNGVGD
ncbi:hypothetical protein EDM53_00750 [Rickettsiales endosymbiont of Peranema trichophorum]|uniref:hypothetical protein n=1 Tax=Rickettsiales endosymbiont of Peranema trichophorum TaxID=2486577 RepID=UPI001023A81F|nr:hypothetical protein [Rickettsiales endosymbiont of Peranema trichophorum]RZI47683.1 hypothetical protein EDM53_00750 [Rickettsiales endosymbiont of Peranema trichophorum]